MLPTIEIGALRLNTYWLIYALAIVIGGMLAFHRLINGGVPPRRAMTGLWAIIWGGAAGAILLKGVGLLVRGGMLAGGLWFRRRDISLGRAFDLFFVPLPLGQAIGRLGCLAAACCYGKPTGSWLGLYLPDHDGFWAVRYPTQLLSAAADLLIFVSLLHLERAVRSRPIFSRLLGFDGALTTTYLLLYSAKRFTIEFLRADTTLRLAGALTLPHVFFALIFLAALIVGVRSLRGQRAPCI
jgi:phosphatidylglycerol:prolipoprotein diacylglycerol transferase